MALAALDSCLDRPASALAHLFGGLDTELMRNVEFEPGSHDLAPPRGAGPARQALRERHALDLSVFGSQAPKAGFPRQVRLISAHAHLDHMKANSEAAWPATLMALVLLHVPR